MLELVTVLLTNDTDASIPGPVDKNGNDSRWYTDDNQKQKEFPAFFSTITGSCSECTIITMFIKKLDHQDDAYQ